MMPLPAQPGIAVLPIWSMRAQGAAAPTNSITRSATSGALASYSTYTGGRIAYGSIGDIEGARLLFLRAIVTFILALFVAGCGRAPTPRARVMEVGNDRSIIDGSIGRHDGRRHREPRRQHPGDARKGKRCAGKRGARACAQVGDAGRGAVRSA